MSHDTPDTLVAMHSSELKLQLQPPPLLRTLSTHPPEDVLLVCPGLVYRRDQIDRLHVGEPHQLDLWRVKVGVLTPNDLMVMIEAVVNASLPGMDYRVTPADHPYTTNGLQIDVEVNDQWVEIGECGLAASGLLKKCGLNTDEISGLAMGLGLDRLLMLRKGIDDIRLLRLQDPRVRQQMSDLNVYQPVSNQPAVKRDLSICVADEIDLEQIGDQVRMALGESADCLESIEITSEVQYQDLPKSAHQRMGMRPGQKNLLLRLTIRHPTQTLTSEEANLIRDKVYLKVHKGNRLELAKK